MRKLTGGLPFRLENRAMSERPRLRGGGWHRVFKRTAPQLHLLGIGDRDKWSVDIFEVT
jgi:hypothetical protein